VDEPRALADCLKELIKNQGLREKMGQQAAEFARQYGWNVIARRIEEIYREVLVQN
jgi:glycosyltransferase involved in cell wall biosynthesis